MTTTSLTARKSAIQSHTGLEIDAYRDTNAPMMPGRVQHNGLYLSNGLTPHWSWKDETQAIKAAVT